MISHRPLVTHETVSVAPCQRVSFPMLDPLRHSANPLILAGMRASRRKRTAFVKYKVFGESIPILLC